MWLKSLNIDSVQKKRSLRKDLFNSLPYPLAVLFDAFYYSVHNRSAGRSIKTLMASYLGRKIKNFA
jgi:hypothetical protein